MVTKEIELAMALSDAGMQKAVSETIQRSTGWKCKSTDHMERATGYPVAVYARCSTKVQSTSLQLKEVCEWCERQGYPVYKIYEDWGVSGRKNSRPGFNRMMEDAKAGRFKAVAVYKLCRFGRNVSDVIHNVLELEAINVRFVSITQGIDTNDRSPMAKVILQLFATFAQFEVDVLTERIVDGVEHAKKYGTKSGKAIGRPRVIVRRDEIRRMKDAGVPVREICRKFGIGMSVLYQACSETTSAKSGDTGRPAET